MIRNFLFALACTGLSSAAKLPDSPEKATEPYEDLIKGKWVHQQEPLAVGSLPFWFYADKKLNKKGKHPLVIVLHGRRNKVQKDKNGKEKPFKVQGLSLIHISEPTRPY